MSTVKRLVRGAIAQTLALQLLAMPALAHAQGATPSPTPAPATPAATPPKFTPEPPTPTGPSVGLRDVLKQAIVGNPTLAGETIDVAIADAQVHETYGLDDWLLDAGVNVQSERTDPVDELTFQTTSSDRVTGNASLQKPLASGGRIGIRLDNTWAQSTQVISVEGMGASERDATVWTPSAQLTFYQPLLRGFGEQTRNAERTRARANRDVQVLEREGTASTVVRDVIQAYWELAYATQDLAIRKTSLALAREQLRITQAGIDVGKLPRSEALAVEQTIATREEDVFLAEQTVSERSIELRRLTGMEIGPGALDLFAADGLDTQAREPELDAALALAMDANPQLKLVRAQGDAATIEVTVTENGLLPQLDFTAAAGPQGNAAKAGDAFEQMGKFDSYQVTAGVTFSMQLGNSGANARAEAARLRVRKAKLSEADVRAQIAAATVRAVNLVRSAKKRMEVSARASGLAQQNVELETARWQVGKSTNFDVLKRQDELAQSQLREARARADYLNAVATLEALTGQLLERYGISLAAA